MLKRGPRKGLTAASISERAEMNLNTTRTTLSFLVQESAVLVVGNVQTGTRGRPANLYAAA